MATHPGRDHAQDEQLGYSLRTGRPGAVALVDDAYGPRLFDYAQVLLTDRDLATQAVRAALLAARTRSRAVPGPERFRAWLYALLRDECLRRVTVRLEPGSLVLNHALAEPGRLEREVAELTQRHGLDTSELAEVLGVSAQRAAELAAQATAKKQEPPPPAPQGEIRTEPPLAAAGRHRIKESKPRRRHDRLVATLTAAGLFALLIAFLAQPWSSDGGRKPGTTSPGPGLAAAPPTNGPGAVPPSGPPTPGLPGNPSVPPGNPGGTGSPSPGAPNDPPGNNPHQPPPATKKPRDPARPPPNNPANGRLSVGDSGCRRVFAAAVAKSCLVTLTAKDGPVRWSVASIDDGTADLSASGGGLLSSGTSTTVTVLVRATVSCWARGGGTGSVGFSPGGVANISYSCWGP